MNEDENEIVPATPQNAVEHDASDKSPSKVKKALSLVNWNLVKESGKLGIKGILQFVGIIGLFVIPNLALIFYCVFRATTASEVDQNDSFLTLGYVVLIGVIFVAYASVLAHKFVLIASVGAVYKNSSAIFRRISEKIVDSAISMTTSKTPLTKQSFQKTINISKLVHSEFGKLPRFFRAGLIFMLKRLPLAGMVTELKDLIVSGNREAASEKLYQKMDELILSILSQNGVIWMLVILLLNTVISVVTIIFT